MSIFFPLTQKLHQTFCVQANQYRRSNSPRISVLDSSLSMSLYPLASCPNPTFRQGRVPNSIGIDIGK
ncbi:hypothetical protein AYI68_g74 [Smittium mucronatum]|uniref:Uncharacterized protein n=1 Tax=Smittium mucronatum TaxID=133383 RepID=A0A1R0H973_9FUNG|nr:hypothetical protein AYI68_g74 [Smittium mucronatum]